VMRDGRPFPPSSAQEVEIVPGSHEACITLRAAGALLFCVTNQPDVARGTARQEDVSAINNRLKDELGLDEVAVCYHDDEDGCSCRKPKPGMLIDLATRHFVELAASVMVGDRWRDIEVGRRAGCRTVFIDGRYAEDRPIGADIERGSLSEALP